MTRAGYCHKCGAWLEEGEGKSISIPAEKNVYGFWEPSRMGVIHKTDCSPVRIKVSISNGQVMALAVDRKAVVLVENVDTGQVQQWTSVEMTSGNVLNFDLTLGDIEKGEK